MDSHNANLTVTLISRPNNRTNEYIRLYPPDARRQEAFRHVRVKVRRCASLESGSRTHPTPRIQYIYSCASGSQYAADGCSAHRLPLHDSRSGWVSSFFSLYEVKYAHRRRTMTRKPPAAPSLLNMRVRRLRGVAVVASTRLVTSSLALRSSVSQCIMFGCAYRRLNSLAIHARASLRGYPCYH